MASKNRTFTDEQALDVVIRYSSSGLSMRRFARQEGISVSCLWQWLQNGGHRIRKVRTPVHPDVELLLYEWVLGEQAKGTAIRNADLVTKATAIAEKLKKTNFKKPSVGWITRFKHRKRLTLTHRKTRSPITSQDGREVSKKEAKQTAEGTVEPESSAS